MKPAESFIEQPVRSLQSMLRVIALDHSDPAPVIPDGIYGETTVQAVSKLQRESGLPVTGITDEITWNLIVEQYEDALIRLDMAESIEVTLDPGEILMEGNSGPYIYLLQSMLIFLSDIHSSIQPPIHNGVYDQQTASAVRDLQKLALLPVTGETDRATWKNIARQFSLNAHHYTLQNKKNIPQNRK